MNTSRAMSRNPYVYPDPEMFKPERFLEPDWPRDAFVPFSAGPRACLGRRSVSASSLLAYCIED